LHRTNNLSSVAYTDGGGDKRMELFLAQDSALYQRAWINGAWQPWADLGHPPDSSPIVGPAALTFWDSRVSRQRIYVFGDNDRLWLNYWDGSTWQWIDQGNP
jgi:hypothetical protein